MYRLIIRSNGYNFFRLLKIFETRCVLRVHKTLVVIYQLEYNVFGHLTGT